MSYKLLKIDDISINVTDGTHSTVIDEPNGRNYLLSAKNIKNGKINYGQTDRKINQVTLNKLRKRTNLEIDDVVITTVGTIGEVAQITDNNPIYEFQRSVAIIKPNKEIIDPIYFKYSLKSRDFKQKAINNSSGSVQKCLFLNTIKKLEVLVNTNIVEQKAIANILSSLDDKIELNNRINQNLETLAQTLYKHWFVDFEFPNENGEPYKSSGGEMVDSELGLIPKGWQQSELRDVVKNHKEKSKENIYPVLSAVKEGKLVLSSEYFTKNVPSINLNKYLIVKKGMFSYNPSRINIGSIGLNEFEFSGCVSPVYVVLKTDNSYIEFFAEYFKTNQFNQEVKTRASGSVRQSLSFDDFGRIKITYPNKAIAEKFKIIYIGFKNRIKLNNIKNQKLAEIRDTLLPKLMTGEIEVPV